MIKTTSALFATLLVSGVIFSGCATISNQTKQKVNIKTSDGSALIAHIDGQKVELPADVNISRNKGATIQILTIDNPCYETTQLNIAGQDTISKWFWGNIIIGGLFGSTTDYISGGMWTYSNPYYIVYPRKKADCKL